ncbi:tRNA (adenosine(37)-N6)-threonylcarbamoyltransferase complex transferase subunit TsaD [Thermus thermamylovorans]|uniref:tRNA N6-adenosine threonylcarbamoyltransferase n=1 Tax=Thermus thermamylovorans TaxID=2509362 RepID=A0A4Q9B130_9DEIN|nr:tRNA (adenosine(37)-N6)-threonylcarbamoyltransferase complex transferase subunit TsaD [Thermus thermamylovorans]TBH16517.1 tRNA (adenosine(37)-N6)-threonylcarbamoyltransferase complex transferase subunit TsaD [Thermus thermamylovorans]
MWILGIDTSCDDTGVGLVRDGEVVVNLVAGQVALHEAYGGVVPELASREHLKVLRPLAERALAEAGIGPKDLSLVAATRGPGLIGALLVGYTFAKGLAWALGRPFYAVHHLEAHIAAAWPEGLEPPFLALVASGGHTHLFEVRALGRYRLLGATRDDAAGEAFDKVARLLGLGFPGGPEIERLAEGAEEAVPFPVPLRGQEGYEFSFSGLKTKALHLVERGLPGPALARGFQEAAIAHLAEVVLRAARDTGHRVLLVAGGVAANRALQGRFREAGLEVHFPPKGLSQDNGAMVALAAWRRHRAGFPPSPLSLGATPYWPLEEA